MSALNHFLKNTVAAFGVIVWFSLPLAAADEARLDRLYAQLKQVEPAEAVKIGNEIVLELSRSGSSAMDLLLKRGRDALEAGQTQEAIEHLTALTDHAPEFAEGWHLRAIAYRQAELFGQAISDLERTLALRPRNFEAIYGLGLILEELGRPDMAHEAYTRVLEIHPHFEDVSEALDRLSGQVEGENL